MSGRRILFVVEALTTGGAQRQLLTLAARLRAAGDRVSLVAYHLVDYDHREYFRAAFEEAGVPVRVIGAMPGWRQFLALRRAVRESRPDVVIAFLWRPSLLAELAGLPRRPFALVVSERTGGYGDPSARDRLRLGLHRLADAVVVNSAWLEERVRRAAPGLGSRLHRITNAVDLARFRPAPAPPPPGAPLRVLVVGRFRPEKNAPALLEALARVRGGPAPLDAVVDWHGNDFFMDGAPSPRSDHFLAVSREVRERGMEGVFRLRAPVDDVVPLYQGADVVCLPSLYESFPNVVCEAMACGRPVLASAVSDAATLVREGENGFLFDPRDPGSIADALRRFAALDPEAREAMGRAGRRRAEALLDPGTLEARWTGVIDAVLAARREG